MLVSGRDGFGVTAGDGPASHALPMLEGRPFEAASGDLGEMQWLAYLPGSPVSRMCSM